PKLLGLIFTGSPDPALSELRTLLRQLLDRAKW
ncbi:MAG: hypothetical protein RJA06_1157, partial [Bacteroidota bacterium]